MEFLRLPAEEAAVRRYVEELWLPYHRDLERAVDAHELADDIDVVDAEMDFRMDRVESDDYRIVVALDSAGDVAEEQDITVSDGELVGFVGTEIDEAPEVFDRPDRLLICDIYVHETYRGEGLARELMAHATERAKEEGCPELTLDVDVDNERARSFYEKLGFETSRNRMVVETGEFPR